MSFRREKYIPKGGPNGGDGGDGGDVILVGDGSIGTLLSLTHKPHYRAGHGIQGKGSQMHGANGDDKIVKVPLGTLITDEDTGDLLADISEEGQELIVAKGGKGGWGNEHFKSATNQAPRETTNGELIEEHILRLELKLIADIGLVGMPNAGKSTLLGAATRAKPKIADYPFTTLYPALGVVAVDGVEFVLADVPGLIEGAHEGRGLGHRFLGHVERCRVLVHVVDGLQEDLLRAYVMVRDELLAYSPALSQKLEIVALNKCDALGSDLVADKCRSLSSFISSPVRVISAATGFGINDLLRDVHREVDSARSSQQLLAKGSWHP